MKWHKYQQNTTTQNYYTQACHSQTADNQRQKKKKNLERSQQGNKSISYREMKIIIADFRSHASKKDWIEIFKLIKENPIKLEFYMQEIIFQNRGRNKDFLRKRKPERIYCQQTCPARSVKRSASGRRKMIQVRNLDLRKERKSIREGISEGRIKLLFFLFLIER